MVNTEPTVNTKLADCLRRRHPRWAERDAVVSQATRVVSGAKGHQPDLLIQSGGRPIVVETEFSPASTLDDDALSRLGKHIVGHGTVDSVVAVRLPERLRHIPESQLVQALDAADDLYWYVRLGEDSRFPESGWLKGGVDEIAGVIESLAVRPEQVEKAADLLQQAVEDASKKIRLLASDADRKQIAKLLHQEEGEQTLRMASIILCNAFLFQCSISDTEREWRIENARSGVQGRLVKRRVLEIWDQILDVDYFPIFDIAVQILDQLSDNTAERVCDVLVEAAEKLVGLGAVEVQDLTGQMLGKLIADRKYLATFYTLPSSATFLAELAVSRLNVDWSDRDQVAGLRIADLACGTGALLSAVYRRVSTRARRAGLDDAELHAPLMEHSLIGADVMPAASHLTAMMLAATHPSQLFEECEIHVVPYGRGESGEIAIGSLDLLADETTLSFLGRASKRLAGRSEVVATGEGSFHLPNRSLDLCIMNPPFTSATNHKIAKVPVPSFAGFDTTDNEQKLMSKRLKQIRKSLDHDPAGNANAGLASDFIDLGHQKLRGGGVLAIVVPQRILSGPSWAKARGLLAAHYQDIVIATIAHERDNAFSADTGMAEAIIVATKGTGQSTKDATFLSLARRPETAMEAIAVVRALSDSRCRVGVTDVKPGNSTFGICVRLPFGSELQGHPGSIAQNEIIAPAVSLNAGVIRLPRTKDLPLPMSPLSTLGARGPVHRDIYDSRDETRGPLKWESLDRREEYGRHEWPMLWHHEYGRETAMTVLPDKYGVLRDTVPDARAVALRLWESRTNNSGEYVAGATRLHLNNDFGVAAQSTAACLTPEKCIGGRAWPSFGPSGGETWEKALCVWLNTTIGLLGRWWVSGRQHPGRAILTVTTIGNIPVIDLTRLESDKTDLLAFVFDEYHAAEMLPANEAYRDPVRQRLDEAVLCEVLGLPEAILPGLATLRNQWCAEPSVHGGKSTKPPWAM